MARPRQVTDVDILKHAREVFLEAGPHVSTQLIADRCGLSQAALFKRFGTKRDLMLQALLPIERPPFVERILLGPDDSDLGEQLKAIALDILLFFREAVPCMATLQASGIDHIQYLRDFDVPPPIRLQRAMTTYLEAAGPRIRADVDRRELATALLGTLHVRAFFHYIGNSGLSEDPKPYINTVVDAFLRGVEATP